MIDNDCSGFSGRRPTNYNRRIAVTLHHLQQVHPSTVAMWALDWERVLKDPWLRSLENDSGLFTHYAAGSRDQRCVAVWDLTAIGDSHNLADSFNGL